MKKFILVIVLFMALIVPALTLLVLSNINTGTIDKLSKLSKLDYTQALANFEAHQKSAVAQLQALPKIVFEQEGSLNNSSSDDKPSSDEPSTDIPPIETVPEKSPTLDKSINTPSLNSPSKLQPSNKKSTANSNSVNNSEIDWQAIIGKFNSNAVMLNDDVDTVEVAANAIFERVAQRNKTIQDPSIKLSQTQRLNTLKQNFAGSVTRARQHIKAINTAVVRAKDLAIVAQNTKDLKTINKSVRELAHISREASDLIISLGDFSKENKQLVDFGS